jgi:hypothetical protein
MACNGREFGVFTENNKKESRLRVKKEMANQLGLDSLALYFVVNFYHYLGNTT